jgi:undecaprenyl-diphosphatase
LQQYGLLALGCGALLETMAFSGIFLPSTALLITGGYLAAEGVLSPYAVWLTVWGCGFAGAQGGYMLGRIMGHKLLGGKRAALAKRIQLALRRRGFGLLLWYQYASILDSLLPYAAGISRYPYRTWLLGTLIGTLGWSIVLPGLGWAAHSALAEAGNQLYWGLLGLGIATALFVGWRVTRDVLASPPSESETAAVHWEQLGR